MSSIHRRMCNKHEELLVALGVSTTIKCISRAQLPLVLKSINYHRFEDFVFNEFSEVLPENIRKWFAIDGKELKGSILPGDTRGLSIVQVVEHSRRRETIAQSYFHGKKSSEVKAVRGLLERELLKGKNVSLDALHLKPDTLKIIQGNSGSYLVGLKSNQKELYEDMEHVPKYRKIVAHHKTVDEHGGRVDTREYSSYNVDNEYFDKRWNDSAFETLIVVKRERFFKTPQKRKKKGKVEYVQQETNTEYFLSNKKLQNQGDSLELFEAIRGHWSVEVNNHIRDVTLKEDDMKIKPGSLNENIALVRTLIVKILTQSKATNFAALMDSFADSFEKLVTFIKNINHT